jgi:hypothetical protein
MIERYLQAREGWQPEAGSGVSVAARLRNGAPLAVEKRYGDGRVTAFLTSVAPNANDSGRTVWNNWTKTPAFPMIALELQSFLGQGRRELDPRAVGATIDVQLEVDKYTRDLKFIAPGDQPDQRVPIERAAEAVSADSPLMQASIGRSTPQQRSGETDQRGVYEAWATTNAGEFEVRRFALNVDPLEGEMGVVPPPLLLEKLEAVSPRVTTWDVVLASNEQGDDGPWAHVFLAILILILLGEQLFAYSFSYHPLRGAAR